MYVVQRNAAGGAAQVAIVDGQKLIDIDIESNARELHKSNIDKAVIATASWPLRPVSSTMAKTVTGFCHSRKLPFPVQGRSGCPQCHYQGRDEESRKSWFRSKRKERGNKGS